MKKTIILLLVFLLALSSVGALASYGAVLNKSTNVYYDANLRRSAGKIPKYTAVAVVSKKSGRTKISFGGQSLWVRNSCLSFPWKDLLKQRKKQGLATEDCLRYVKKTCYIYDYPSKSGHKLMKVKKGTVLTGFKEKNGWSILMDKNEVYYGYAKTSNLEGISGGDGTHYKLSR